MRNPVLALNMVHDISVNQLIDIMERHGARSARLSMLMDSKLCARNADYDYCQMIHNEETKSVGFSFGSEYTYVHHEEVIDEWINCNSIAAKRGYIAECQRSVGLLKIFTIAFAPSGNHNLSTIPRRYAFEKAGYTNVPLPNFQDLIASLNLQINPDKKWIKKQIHKTRYVPVPTNSLQKIIEFGLARTDKIWQRPNTVHFIRSLSFSIINDERKTEPFDVAPVFDEFVNAMFIYLSALRFAATKGIGVVMTAMQEKTIWSSIKDKISSCFFDYGYMNSRVAAGLLMYTQLFVSKDTWIFDEIYHEEDTHYGQRQCEHGLDIDEETDFSPTVNNLPLGKVFMHRGNFDRISTEFDEHITTACSTINARKVKAVSHNCFKCMSEFDYIILKRDDGGEKTLFSEGEGFLLDTSGLKVSRNRNYALHKNGSSIVNFNQLQALGFMASSVNFVARSIDERTFKIKLPGFEFSARELKCLPSRIFTLRGWKEKSEIFGLLRKIKVPTFKAKLFEHSLELPQSFNYLKLSTKPPIGDNILNVSMQHGFEDECISPVSIPTLIVEKAKGTLRWPFRRSFIESNPKMTILIAALGVYMFLKHIYQHSAKLVWEGEPEDEPDAEDPEDPDEEQHDLGGDFVDVGVGPDQEYYEPPDLPNVRRNGELPSYFSKALEECLEENVKPSAPPYPDSAYEIPFPHQPFPKTPIAPIVSPQIFPRKSHQEQGAVPKYLSGALKDFISLNPKPEAPSYPESDSEVSEVSKWKVINSIVSSSMDRMKPRHQSCSSEYLKSDRIMVGTGAIAVKESEVPFDLKKYEVRELESEHDCFFESMCFFVPESVEELRGKFNKPYPLWGGGDEMKNSNDYTFYVKHDDQFLKIGEGEKKILMQYTGSHYNPYVKKNFNNWTEIDQEEDWNTPVEESTPIVFKKKQDEQIECVDDKLLGESAFSYLASKFRMEHIFVCGGQIAHPKAKHVESLDNVPKASPVLTFGFRDVKYKNSLAIMDSPGIYKSAKVMRAPYGVRHYWVMYSDNNYSKVVKPNHFELKGGFCNSCHTTRSFLPFHFKIPKECEEHHFQNLGKMKHNHYPPVMRGKGDIEIKEFTMQDILESGKRIGKFETNSKNMKIAQYFGLNLSESSVGFVEHQYVDKGNPDLFSEVNISITKENAVCIMNEMKEQVLALNEPFINLHKAAREGALYPEKDLDFKINICHGVAGSGKSSLLRNKVGNKGLYVCTTKKLVEEYRTKGFQSCTVAKFMTMPKKNQKLVMDESFLMHSGVLVQAILLGYEVYLIGDPNQGRYGNDEMKTKYPIEHLYNEEEVVFRYVSHTVPRDVAFMLRNNNNYPIFTTSKIEKSLYRVQNLDSKETTICFLKETRENNKNALTSPQVQGSRYKKLQMIAEVNCLPLIQNVPAMLLVNLTRHSERLEYKADHSAFIHNMENQDYAEYMMAKMKGGSLKRLLNDDGTRTEFLGVQFGDVARPSKDYDKFTTKQWSCENKEVIRSEKLGFEMQGLKKTVQDQIELPDMNLLDNGYKSSNQVVEDLTEIFKNQEQFTKTANEVKFEINERVRGDFEQILPIFDINNSVNRLEDFEGQEEVFAPEGLNFVTEELDVPSFAAILDEISPTSLTYGSVEDYVYHNRLIFTNRTFKLKFEEEVFQPTTTEVRRLMTQLRGRPYVAGNVNQQVHTACTRSRDPDLGISDQEKVEISEKLFGTYKKYVKPVQATNEMYMNSVASYLSRVFAKKGGKMNDYYDEEIYDLSSRIDFFTKIQTKKDLKPDSFLRYNGVETKAGQSVCPEPKGVNNLTSPAVRTIEQCVLAGVNKKIHLHFGATAAELRNKVQRSKGIDYTFVCSDYTEFDTFHDSVSSVLMARIFDYHGINPSVLDILEKHDKSWKMHGKNVHVDMCRHLKSGRPDTLLKNTLFSMCLNLTFLDFDDLYFAAFVGDDSLLKVRKFRGHTYPDGYASKTKLEVGPIGSFIGYLVTDDLYLDVPRVACGVSNKSFPGENYKETIAEYQLGVRDQLMVIYDNYHLEKNLQVCSYAYKISPEKIRSLLSFISSYCQAKVEEISELLIVAYSESKQITPNEDDLLNEIRRIKRIPLLK